MSNATFPGWTLEEALHALVPYSILEPWQHPYREGTVSLHIRERWEFEDIPARWFWEQKNGEFWQEFPQGSDEWRQQERAARAAKEAARHADAYGPLAKEEERRRITEKEEATSRVLSYLKDLIRTGAVSSWGMRGGFAGEFLKIPPTQWIGVDGFMLNGSVVGVKTDHQRRSRRAEVDLQDLVQEWSFYSVHVYPALRAPDAVEAITGLGVSEVVGRFVWGDPEALRIWVSGMDRGDRMPNDTLDIAADRGVLIALHQDAKKMRGEIDRSGLAGKLGIDVAAYGNPANQYLDVLADRLAALGDLIAAARVGLTGFDAQGNRVAIDSDEVEIGRLLVCLGTGDFYRADEGGGAIRNVRIVDPAVDEVPSAVVGIPATKGVTSDEGATGDGPTDPEFDIEYKLPNKKGFKWAEGLEEVLSRALRHDGKPISSYGQLCIEIAEEMSKVGTRIEADSVQRRLREHLPWLARAAKDGRS